MGKNKKLVALSDEIMFTVKPDCSNVVRSVEDAMIGVVWVDDKQAEKVIVRAYSESITS
ncbi:MAG: RusA family crossover junction endodeoxyribonuclease [Nitrosomonas sp.]|nr:RusA family crossover junction endodeoxyribonuclease [Nitrosomonas sp.]